jgi:ribose transport system permease protein
MVVVLLLLCLFFSVVTWQKQSPTGAQAGEQVASDILAAYGPQARVLIVARSQPDDRLFASAVAETLSTAGAKDVEVVVGEPRDARKELQRQADDSRKLDAIAATSTTAAWLVITDRATTFPTLATSRVFTPATYSWPNFLKRDNLLNIANQIAVIAVVAIGATLVIITGGIDLSVGSLIALAAVVATLLIESGGATDASVLVMVGASLSAIVVCGLVGLFSGSLVTMLGIRPFIVTLAMMLVGRGVAYILARGQSVYKVPESFVWLGRGANLFGIPNAVLLTLVLYGIAHVLMSRTVLGRHLYAVGGNRRAAFLSGIPVKSVVMFAYVCSGALAGLGGVVMASQYRSGSPTYGNMYELYTIAAVVVGGTSLKGGEGRVFGTLVGALVIAVIQNGMNLTNVEPYTQMVVLGLVILGAVIVDTLRQRFVSGRPNDE